MKIQRPSHATVVAYLALFVALGGSAYAVSKVDTNNLKRAAVTSPKIQNKTIAAEDLKPLVLRQRERSVAPGATEQHTAIVHCRKRELLVAGSGGWIADGNVTRVLAIRRGLRGHPVGYEVSGTNPDGSADTLVAEAICLPK